MQFRYNESYITKNGVKTTQTKTLNEEELLKLNYDKRTIHYITKKGKYSGSIGNNRYCNITIINS